MAKCDMGRIIVPIVIWITVWSSGHAIDVVSHDKVGNRLAESASIPLAPVIVTPPGSRLGKSGGSASFTVIATGSGPLTYEWRRNNENIPTATASTLFLENLTPSDFTAYSVVVSNGLGSATSTEAQLILDADEDSLADDWETINFGSITAQTFGGDADGDGISNLEEYNDATQPNNAASRYFKLTISGGGVAVTPAKARYAPGTVVTLSAQDQGGLEFTGWTGSATGAASPLQVTMDADKVIRAMRSALPLDNTFSPVITSEQGLVRVMIRLPDGKFLVAGHFDAVHGIPRMNVARLNADWTLDTSFQGPTFNRAISSQEVRAAAVQSDGKIIIAGYFSSLNGATSPPIARLQSNGAVDPTFVSPSISGGSGVIEALSIQPDDKILLSGYFLTVAGISRLHVARLMPGGALDTTFNTSTGPNDRVNKVVWQAPGKILIGGSFSQVGAIPRNRIARLTDIGALDTSFDPGTGANGNVNAILVDSAGRIILGGDFNKYNGTDAEPLVRVFDNGSRDLSFNCYYSTSPGTKWEFTGPVNQIIEQPDGKIIAAQCDFYQTNPPYEYLIGPVRFAPNGDRDASFAPDFSPWEVVCMLRDNNGDFRFGGEFTSINGVAAFNLGRLTAGNQVPAPISSATLASSAKFLPYPDGSLLLFGDFDLVSGEPRNGVAKLSADGSVDRTFVPGVGDYEGYYFPNLVRAAAIQNDGKVVIGGRVWVDDDDLSVARLNVDGSLDASFNPPSAITTGSDPSVLALAMQSDGKIVVGGFFTSTTPSLQNLARLESNGMLDNSFTAMADSLVGSIDIGSDDRVLIGGDFSTVNGVARRRVAILKAGGRLDESFSTGSEPAPGSPNPRIHQARFIDGLVAIAGPFSYTSQTRAGIAVLSPSGALDPNRNTQGILTSFGSSNQAACISPRANGGLWVGGSYTQVDGSSRKYMAPFQPSGVLDTGTVNDLQIPNGSVYSIHEASNGDLVASGAFTQAGGMHRVGVARYVTTNRMKLGTLATVPNGPQFSLGSNIEMNVSAEAVPGAVVAVEMEYSTNGWQFTPLKEAISIGPDSWQATASITGLGVFYLRATAVHTNGSRRSSYAIGPFEAVSTPVISGPALVTGLVNQPFSFTATASGAPLSNFSATNLPSWATFTFRPATNDALLSGTPTSAGETVVGLTATNSNGSGHRSVRVQIFDTYESWKTTQFTVAELADPLLSGAEADFDHDGLSNFVEFGLRSLPKTPDLASKPQVSLVTLGQSQYLTLTYRRYKWAGATFTIQVTGDLQTWNSGAAHTTEVSRTDHGDGTETVVTRDNTPVSPLVQRMMRLRLQ